MPEKIDIETAQLMFDEWCENWRILTDTAKMKQDDVQDFEIAKSRIIEAFQDGRLENSADDPKTVIYRFAYPQEAGCESIKIRRPRGQTYMQTDSSPKDAGMKKTFLMISEMTGKPVSFFSSVEGYDIKLIMAVANLFFGS